MSPELIHSRLVSRAREMSWAAWRKSEAETASGHTNRHLFLVTGQYSPHAPASSQRSSLETDSVSWDGSVVHASDIATH
jgi:hypothetical protein